MWALLWRRRIERRLLSSSRQIPLRRTLGIANQGVEECRKQSQATTTENAPSRPYGLKDMSIHIPHKVIVIHIRYHKMRTQVSTLTMSHSQSHQRLLRNLKETSPKRRKPATFSLHRTEGRPQTTITCPFYDFMPHASPRSYFWDLEQYWCQICPSLYLLQKDQVCIQRLHLTINHVSRIKDRWLRVELEESGASERSHTVVYMTLRRIMEKDHRGLGTEFGGSLYEKWSVSAQLLTRRMSKVSEYRKLISVENRALLEPA